MHQIWSKEIVGKVQDSAVALATTVATTPNTGEDVLIAPQVVATLTLSAPVKVVATLTLAAPVTEECLPPSLVKDKVIYDVKNTKNV